MAENAFERFRRLRGIALPVSPLALLTTLHAQGVVLTPTCEYGPGAPHPDGSRPLVFGLHIDAPPGVLTEAYRLAIQHHQAALIDLLDEWGERAGIFEYEAGLPRAEAEAHAWAWLETQNTVEGEAWAR